MFDGSSQSLPSVAFWTAWAHSGRSRKRPGVPFYYVRRVLAVITVGGVLDRVGAQREEQEAARRAVLLCSTGPRSHYRRWRSGPRGRTAGGAGSGQACRFIMFDGSSQSLPSVAFWTAWAHSGRSRKRRIVMRRAAARRAFLVDRSASSTAIDGGHRSR